jgi:hypothetical protein
VFLPEFVEIHPPQRAVVKYWKGVTFRKIRPEKGKVSLARLAVQGCCWSCPSAARLGDVQVVALCACSSGLLCSMCCSAHVACLGAWHCP